MSKINILGFDSVASAANAVDVPMKLENGDETGVVFQVIGKNADAVQNWVSKVANKAIIEQSQANRGKPVAPKKLEELRAQNIEGACVRVIGWKNVEQEFSKDLLAQVLAKNPHFIDQIIEASDEASNFTKAK